MFQGLGSKCACMGLGPLGHLLDCACALAFVGMGVGLVSGDGLIGGIVHVGGGHLSSISGLPGNCNHKQDTHARLLPSIE